MRERSFVLQCYRQILREGKRLFDRNSQWFIRHYASKIFRKRRFTNEPRLLKTYKKEASDWISNLQRANQGEEDARKLVLRYTFGQFGPLLHLASRFRHIARTSPTSLPDLSVYPALIRILLTTDQRYFRSALSRHVQNLPAPIRPLYQQVLTDPGPELWQNPKLQRHHILGCYKQLLRLANRFLDPTISWFLRFRARELFARNRDLVENLPRIQAIEKLRRTLVFLERILEGDRRKHGFLLESAYGVRGPIRYAVDQAQRGNSPVDMSHFPELVKLAMAPNQGNVFSEALKRHISDFPRQIRSVYAILIGHRPIHNPEMTDEQLFFLNTSRK
eukprot:TRINITY_DN1239_c0_g1_i2.p1 TRINITY_DN1239_c0_g1~~TRINITY_DN1239_c0_g1_i2.p1  ORF type:complete len:333 (+),score=21.60 TRINITY_DN1239_c0_g1_i2:46-1044(+)